MKLSKSILPILVITFVFLSACIKVEDPVIDVPEGTATFSAKINGETFSVSGVQVTAEYVSQNVMVQTLGIAAAELPVNGVTRAIALAIVSTDSSGINEGETYVATSTSKAGAGEYNYDNGTVDIKALSSITDVATITITKIDYNSKHVSGTFSFNGADDQTSSTIYIITDGVFTDVPFD